jgi:hypothetical protein
MKKEDQQIKAAYIAGSNANVFCGQLKQLITEAQQNTTTTGYTGRLI